MFLVIIIILAFALIAAIIAAIIAGIVLLIVFLVNKDKKETNNVANTNKVEELGKEENLK